MKTAKQVNQVLNSKCYYVYYLTDCLNKIRVIHAKMIKNQLAVKLVNGSGYHIISDTNKIIFQ